MTITATEIDVALLELQSSYKEENLRDQNKLDLNKDFCKLLDTWLLSGGIEKIAINYKVLRFYFHPDKKALWKEPVIWLNQKLSQEKQDKICFQILEASYIKQLTQDRDVENLRDNIEWQALKTQLQVYYEEAKTDLHKFMFNSLRSLMEELETYCDQVDKVNIKVVSVLLRIFPVVLEVYTAYIFIPELFIIYSTSLFLLTWSTKLQNTQSNGLRRLGNGMSKVGDVSFSITTGSLLHLFRVIYYASNKILLQCNGLSMPTMSPSFWGENQNAKSPALALCYGEYCDEVLEQSKNKSIDKIQTKELKTVLEQFESYLTLNKSQYLHKFRTGYIKSVYINHFVLKVHHLDKLAIPIEDKLILTHKYLDDLKKNNILYSGNAKIVIDAGKNTLELIHMPFFNESEEEDYVLTL